MRPPAAPAPGASAPAKVICFTLAGQDVAIPIGQVKETIVLRPITRVFLTPRWVAGLVNLRGDVVAVLDLAALLDVGRTTPGDDTRIVVAQADGKRAGLLVDRLDESRAIDPARLAPPPPTLSPETAELCAGVVTREDGSPLLVLDMPRLFACERLKPFARRSAS
jgi:purine-binding chemotaxis protein CheW